MPCFKIARRVLGDYPPAAKALSFLGSRKTSVSGRIDQARDFFTNALSDPEILRRLAPLGVTQARLEAGLALIERLERARGA